MKRGRKSLAKSISVTSNRSFLCAGSRSEASRRKPSLDIWNTQVGKMRQIFVFDLFVVLSNPLLKQASEGLRSRGMACRSTCSVSPKSCPGGSCPAASADRSWLDRPRGSSECPVVALPEDPHVEVADLALGCFWAPDQYFSNLDGVLEVTVGYSGGKQSSPSYKNIKDHTETVRVVYSPEHLSYEELLEYFFEQLESPPLTLSRTRQYRIGLFYHNSRQKAAIDEKLALLSRAYKGRRIFVDVEPASAFYRAEEYHQKYLLKKSQRSASMGQTASSE